jgi:hypothetical protein
LKFCGGVFVVVRAIEPPGLGDKGKCMPWIEIEIEIEIEKWIGDLSRIAVATRKRWVELGQARSIDLVAFRSRR